jgi:serine/threonine-protein kinase
MGQVYRARDPRLGREVAIKVLSGGLAEQPNYLERFDREARAIAQLNHPNIVSIFDYGKQGKTTYLVMPLIAGGTLRDMLAQRRMLPLGDAVALVEQVGAALHYAHERGLVHRDVKPANILVGPDGRALLSELGMGRVVLGEETGTTLTSTGAFVGSPDYAAPEMVLSQPIDRRADVYALGMLLFQMLTGRTAFAAETPVQLLIMQAQQPPPSPRSLNPGIPPAVEAVILRALAKSPDQRYSTAEELVAALRAEVGAQAVGGQTPLPPGANVYELPTLRREVSAPPAQAGARGEPTTLPVSGWAVPPQGALPAQPTFATGGGTFEQTLPVEPRRMAPGGVAVGAGARPAQRRRMTALALAALALVLIVGGGGVLAAGLMQGWFGGKTGNAPLGQGSPGTHPTNTTGTQPSPTALPTFFYMGHDFVVLTSDLQPGHTADTMVNFNSTTYPQHEGPKGDVYRFGDALTFGSLYDGATIIRDSAGAFIFVVLVDRFDTYQHAHQYYLRDLTLLAQATTLNLEEEASGGFVAVSGGKQSYEVFVRDRNIVLTIAAVPSTNAQDYSAYFVAMAQAAQQRAHRCHYMVTDPNNPGGSLKLVAGSPSDC